MSAQFSVPGLAVKGERNALRCYNMPMRIYLRYWMLPGPLWLLAALLLSQPVHAALVDDIYRAAVPVLGRDAATLRDARRAGLGEVIVKASGDMAATDSPLVVAALAEAERYLLSYSYEEGRDQALSLRLEYDALAVQQLLRSAGLSLWTANRPEVLAWLVVSDAGRRRFVTLDASPDEDQSLRRSFQRRGVPLRTPLYDLEDSAAISPGEAWRQSSVALIDASRRYRDVELLAGRVARLSGGAWLGDWRFLDNGRWITRSVSVDSLEAFTDAGADFVATTLAGRYAVTLAPDADQRHRVTLRGVRSYADYVDLQRALLSLEAVSRVVPESLLGDQVSLRIEAEADVRQLARIIELDPRFVALPASPAGKGLQYEWIQ